VSGLVGPIDVMGKVDRLANRIVIVKASVDEKEIDPAAVLPSLQAAGLEGDWEGAGSDRRRDKRATPRLGR
jgi:hypothetical protein